MNYHQVHVARYYVPCVVCFLNEELCVIVYPPTLKTPNTRKVPATYDIVGAGVPVSLPCIHNQKIPRHSRMLLGYLQNVCTVT